MQITSKLDTKNLRLIERLAQSALTVIHKPITQIHMLGCAKKKSERCRMKYDYPNLNVKDMVTKV